MSSRFDIQATKIAGLNVLQRQPIGDKRGYLERLFCANDLHPVLAQDKTIVQINHTLTEKKHTLRGMHFQYPPHAETKLVSCIAGEVYDVAIDMRTGSPTFLQWHAVVLTDENHKTLLIPEGFAHGFQTLTDNCELLYFHTAAYQSDCEGGLHPQDPRLSIQWPQPVTGLSQRDQSHTFLNDTFKGVEL